MIFTSSEMDRSHALCESQISATPQSSCCRWRWVKLQLVLGSSVAGRGKFCQSPADGRGFSSGTEWVSTDHNSGRCRIWEPFDSKKPVKIDVTILPGFSPTATNKSSEEGLYGDVRFRWISYSQWQFRWPIKIAVYLRNKWKYTTSKQIHITFVTSCTQPNYGVSLLSATVPLYHYCMNIIACISYIGLHCILYIMFFVSRQIHLATEQKLLPG